MIYTPISNAPTEVSFYENYFNIDPTLCSNYKYDVKCENETDIYVIAFNNPFFVNYQIKTLRQFFKAPYNLIIVDNNNGLHKEASEKVLSICREEDVIYLKAPDNYYQDNKSFDPSMKLGTTINWLYQKCIKVRKPKYFGFLDHDCFLIKPFNICSYLDLKGMYGRICIKDSGAWNLHVTANFYRLGFIKDKQLDFRASHKHLLDTGGANYDIVYKEFNSVDYELSIEGFRYADHDVNRKDSVQHYEIIDGCWFHMAASTHDQLVGDGQYKLIYAKGFLDAILNTLK